MMQHQMNKQQLLQHLTSADDDTGYLSTQTVNRRQDRKLIDYITSALYRLELENVKPSFDVKLRAGLHRGPFTSSRGRRRRGANNRSASSTALNGYPDDTGSIVNGISSPPPSAAALRPRSASHHSSIDNLLRGATVHGSSWQSPSSSSFRAGLDTGHLDHLSTYDHRGLGGGSGRYVDDEPSGSTIIDRYATMPRRWLRELEKIEADSDRYRRAASTTTISPAVVAIAPPARPHHHHHNQHLLHHQQQPAVAASKDQAARGRQSAVADEFDDLMSYLHREKHEEETGVNGFFHDERRPHAVTSRHDGDFDALSPVDVMLMERPFGRVHRGHDDVRTLRLNESAGERFHSGRLLYR